MNQYSDSPITMRQTLPKSLVMAKKMSHPKNMCNSKWNVALCNMKTKLKPLKESNH